ncbi:MAG: AraC family transcriptional regulator [Acidovorax sp.]|nr:AraC family transcriptional regulator [Acidovorax sp.]
MIMRRFPTDWESRLYGPQRISSVVAALAEEGVGAEQVLEGVGLNAELLQSTSTRVSYGQVLAVFRNAIRLAKDPAWAFHAGARMHLTAYGMYGYGILSSPTHEDQIRFVMKYNRASGGVARIVDFLREGMAAAYTYEVALTSDPQDSIYRFALEFTYAAQLRVCRDLYGADFNFSSVSAVFPKPGHAESYERFFDCPVHFLQPVNQLHMNASWLDLPRSMPDKVTHLMADEFCQQFLADLPHVGGVASQVRQALLEKTPLHFPTIDLMADELGMQARTLRRRLEAEDTTYRELLSSVRKLLAIEYLRKTRMTTVEIAARLGYNDVANFRNAFTRWTGKTPHSYRVMGK